MNQIGSEDEIPIWDRRAFGIQVPFLSILNLNWKSFHMFKLLLRSHLLQKAFPRLEKPVTANSDLFRHFSETGAGSIFNLNGASGLYQQIFLTSLNCWQALFIFYY